MNESMNTILFTPAAVLDLLSQIDELSDLDIGMTETIDGKIQCQIGSSIYEIDNSNATTISVDTSTADTIEDVNEQAYDDIVDEFDDSETIESGIIKEIAKTLLLGGMLRVGSKILK